MSADLPKTHADDQPILMCMSWPLPEDLDQHAQLRAIQENPNNILKPAAGSPYQLAGDTRKFWQPGTELHFRFRDNIPNLRAKVITYAQLWLPHVNLRFVFDDSPTAQIRVQFKHGIGSHSRVGIDALEVPPDQYTMNLDPNWFNNDRNDVVLKRTVLHEFGHVLGFIHEHLSPSAHIAWDEDKVIAAFSGAPNYWTPDYIRFNVLDQASVDTTNSSAFDRRSIMLYPIDPRLTTNNYRVDWNNELSETDKAFATTIYPQSANS